VPAGAQARDRPAELAESMGSIVTPEESYSARTARGDAALKTINEERDFY
jgi:hypothetical protein